jgi:hypothetical protein
MANDSAGHARPFSQAERKEIISSLDAAIARRDAVAERLNAAHEDRREEIAAELVAAQREVTALYQRYERGLPRPALSRCPFTGDVVRLAIDTFGLDGPWWNYEVPARPIEPLPPTLFAVTGSVAFGEPVPATPFVCRPGPAVPFVVPRMLVHPEIRAVVSQLRIGTLDAYAVLYFSADPPLDIARANDWGLDRYLAEDAAGAGYGLRVIDDERDFDCDLAFYIRSGRQMWIAPGDETLTLRSVITGCPYLDLPGRRHPVAIFDRRQWDTYAVPASETPAMQI